MWLYLHGSLPTAQVLGSRGLILDLMCKMCNKDYETINTCLEVVKLPTISTEAASSPLH